MTNMRYDRALFRGGTGSGWTRGRSTPDTAAPKAAKPKPVKRATRPAECGNCKRRIEAGTVIVLNHLGRVVHANCPAKAG